MSMFLHQFDAKKADPEENFSVVCLFLIRESEFDHLVAMELGQHDFGASIDGVKIEIPASRDA